MDRFDTIIENVSTLMLLLISERGTKRHGTGRGFGWGSWGEGADWEGMRVGERKEKKTGQSTINKINIPTIELSSHSGKVILYPFYPDILKPDCCKTTTWVHRMANSVWLKIHATIISAGSTKNSTVSHLAIGVWNLCMADVWMANDLELIASSTVNNNEQLM